MNVIFYRKNLTFQKIIRFFCKIFYRKGARSRNFFRKNPAIYTYIRIRRTCASENCGKFDGSENLRAELIIMPYRNPKKYIPRAGPWSGQNLSTYILRIYVYVYTYTFDVAVLATLALSRKVLALAGNRAALRFTCSHWQWMTTAKLGYRLSNAVRALGRGAASKKPRRNRKTKSWGAVFEAANGIAYIKFKM